MGGPHIPENNKKIIFHLGLNLKMHKAENYTDWVYHHIYKK
jgi:hypothetical protein